MNEDQLRRILEAEASTVEVRPDALATIRERTARRRRTWWLPVLAAAGATVAATTAAVAVVTFARPPSTPEPEPLPPAASVPVETTAAGTLLPVYYLGAGERLYREYHPLPTGGGSVADKVGAAVAAMLGDRASDPGYRTAWPAGSVRDVRVDGDVVTVDLDVPTVPDAAGVQQLVWTVTAVSGKPDVKLLVRGRLPAGAAGTLRRGPALTTLAPVWLIDPQDGTVSGPRIAVRLSAAGHDPVVRLEVRQGDRVVHAQSVTLTDGTAQRGEGKLTLPALPAGEYVVRAVNTSAAGGLGYPDDHRVTVR